MDVQKLCSVGIDYNQGLERFNENKEMYEGFLFKFFAMTDINQLQTLIHNKEMHKAFLFAHGLKGETGNLSLNALYKEICILVELLRNEIYSDEILPEYENVKELYDFTKNAVESQKN